MRMPEPAIRSRILPLAAAIAAALLPAGALAQSPPVISVTQFNFNFGNVPVGTSSGTQSSTLINTGPVTWFISSTGSPSCYGGAICYGGAEFTCSTTCTYGGITPGGGCTITASFNPTFTGPQSVTFQICDNSTTNPQNFTFYGNGVPPPSLVVAPNMLDFGDVPVGTVSPRRFVNVQNNGTASASFNTAITGPFVVASTTCSNPVPGSSSCDIDLTFNPTGPGVASGDFTIAAGASPTTVQLKGNGTLGPVLILPTDIDFNFELGGTPARQTLTLTNGGTVRLDLSSIVATGPFTVVNNCPAFLGPRESCTVILGFSAADQGEFDGLLSIFTNAGTRTIVLRGRSRPKAVPVLQLSPQEIGFGDQALGVPSRGETVKIKNVGGATAVFSSIVTSPDFVVLNHTCQQPLAPQATCEANVAMRALGYGTRGGKFIVNSNADNNPATMSIFGTGCRGAGPALPRIGVYRGCMP